ncbi:MAG: thiamine phosphate synthase [Myxococcaceae bacterium]|nr:thiamine phosphate synthase [Myxococcaceae bacterium]
MALKLPRGLYALVDDGVRAEVPVPEKARWALAGGARVLQLRLEQTGDRQALVWIREVVAAARPVGAVILVNDRVDLCLVGEADGVHVGDDDLPVEAARRVLGPGALIGRTVRRLDDIHSARAHGADHVGLGPVFTTTTKQVNVPALGLAGLAAICRESPLPVVGIAGISLETIGTVAQAGVHAAAVASDWLTAQDPVSRVQALERAFWGP